MSENVEVLLLDVLCYDVHKDLLDGLCSQLVLDDVVL